MMKVLLVGCGRIASSLASRLSPQDYSCTGLRRSQREPGPGITPLSADVCDPTSLKALAGSRFDIAVVTLTPQSYDEEGYRRIYQTGLGNLLAVLNTDFLVLVSSTSVYHQKGGEWVDESSATTPSHFSGRSLLAAERLVRQHPAPSTIVRFSGIYGNGRTRFVDQVLGGGQFEDGYSNRIHQDDCVGFLAHLLAMRKRGDPIAPIYLASDSLPSRLSDVASWILDNAAGDIEGSATKIKRRSGSRRCRNSLMTESGYQLKYPDYRSGYAAVLNSRRND